MRLWTLKFAVSLVVVTVFLFDAFFLGPDPVTGRARHVVPFADTGIASFAFLLGVLYVFSHAWQWLMWHLRGPREAEAAEPGRAESRRRKRRRR